MSGRVLVTGATGYIGGLLVTALEQEGVPVRCMARDPDRLRGRVADGTQVVRGNVLDPASLPPALEGVDVAYYLVHSMGGAGDFRAEDRRAARAFGDAALAAGVRRLVYLGGLGRGPGLSHHLESRQEVGAILAASGVPTVELRSGIVIGSGSFPFEMVCALVDRLPVMITPRWVDTPTQPIAADDVVAYLREARTGGPPDGGVFEIGGASRVTYGGLMREYARQRGLRRYMVRVPVLTPRLSSLWLGLVTPVHARIGRELVDGLRNSTVVHDPAALTAFRVRPRPLPDQIALALDRDRALGRGMLEDVREAFVPLEAPAAFRPLRRIGGASGWYFGNWMWRLRGIMDIPFGGQGMRRGRPDPDQLHAGDPVDAWRVEAVDPGRLLRLRAEMSLPGGAWLEFDVRPAPGGSVIRQRALFEPRGVTGRAYWYAVWPVHQVVFPGMLRGIARAAMRSAEG